MFYSMDCRNIVINRQKEIFRQCELMILDSCMHRMHDHQRDKIHSFPEFSCPRSWHLIYMPCLL
jgi:hypothetical protein